MLCQRTINKQQLEGADQLLIKYCEMYVELYGKENCTPNLHLHGHLASCIRDYGPVYAFWLFSFERLNGILGSYHHTVSVQVMRQFLNNQNYAPHMWPTEFKDDFLPLLAGISYCKGSLMHSTLESVINSGNCMELVEALPPVRVSFPFTY